LKSTVVDQNRRFSKDSGKRGLVPPFASKINENASFRKHRKHGKKKRLKTPAKKSSSANEYEHESPTSVAAFFDSPSIRTTSSKKHDEIDCYFSHKKIDRRHSSLVSVQFLFREINKAKLQSVVSSPISTSTAKLLADEAVIMSDIFRKRELAEKATKEHRDLFYLGVDEWKNNKLCKRMEKSACRYGGAEMLCRFYRRECRFQYSIVKEFLEKKILRDGFSSLSNRFFNREFPYEYSSVEKEENLRKYYSPATSGESSHLFCDMVIGADDATPLVVSCVAPGTATHDIVIGAVDAAPLVVSCMGAATHDMVIGAEDAAPLVVSCVAPGAATHDMVIGAEDAAPLVAF
jgi:hypothetical protein